MASRFEWRCCICSLQELEAFDQQAVAKPDPPQIEQLQTKPIPAALEGTTGTDGQLHQHHAHQGRWRIQNRTGTGKGTDHIAEKEASQQHDQQQ
jgi:hypothetical protein